jgi:hypothetical protein
LFEGVGDRILEAERRPVASGGVPRVRSVARSRILEEGGVESGVDRVVGSGVAMDVRGADEARGAVHVAVDRGDRGKSEESFARVGEIDRLAAELKLLRNAHRAASVSLANTATSPAFPRTIVSIAGSSSVRAIGSARSRNVRASRSLPSHRAE